MGEVIARLRDGGDERSIPLAALDAEIRAGQVDPDAEICYPPWTGPRFCALRHVAPLSAAWDAPEARLHWWMATPRPPALALLVAGIITVAAGVQTVLARLGLQHPAASAIEAAWVRWGEVGFDPTLLSGHWWSPLASQLVHAPDAPLVHLAANLPVLAYCGIRVQRALGAGGYAVVAALGLLCGAGLVIAGSDLPVVGSSLLAYSLWAAQIGIGFRYGRCVPPRLRGFYGWGTWVIFAPLTLLNATFGHVSQLGHVGAIGGGLLAVAVLEPESAVPRALERAQRRRNCGWAAGIAALSAVLAWILPWAPALLVEPGVETPLEAEGATLTLPTRMAPFTARRWGMDMFRPSPDTDDLIFAGLADEVAAPEEAAFWAARLEGPVRAEGPWRTLNGGWQEQILDLGATRIISRRLRRGRWTLRVGELLSDPKGARARFYDAILRSLVVGDPPELAAARRALDTSPSSPRLTLALVDALVRADDRAEADTVLARLAQRSDGWGANAAAYRRALAALQ